MSIKIGTAVVTRSGIVGTVTGVERIPTGKRGRKPMILTIEGAVSGQSYTVNRADVTPQVEGIRVGQNVITANGTKAVVKGFDKVMTGRQGRPAKLVRVQERNARGHFVPGVVTFRPNELKAA